MSKFKKIDDAPDRNVGLFRASYSVFWLSRRPPTEPVRATKGIKKQIRMVPNQKTDEWKGKALAGNAEDERVNVSFAL